MAFRYEWQVGITTVHDRLTTTLPTTLRSLTTSGFTNLRLFVDGCTSQQWISWEKYIQAQPPPSHHDAPLVRDQEPSTANVVRDQGKAGLTYEVTLRYPKVRTHANFVLSLYELYLRNPSATVYAVFQDDLLCSRNLKEYLEASLRPMMESGEKGYYNLFLMQSNEPMIPNDGKGWPIPGWCNSNQLGRSALGLVFPRQAVIDLLSGRHMVERACDTKRGHKAVDGGIVTTLAKVGYVEKVHWPSLLQHTGEVSAIGNLPHKPAMSFKGENYNLLDLLPNVVRDQG